MYDFKKSVIGYFDKSSNTEYQNNKARKYNLKFNDIEIDIRYWDLIIVTHNYDLNFDMKLGSKSLLLKYFESILSDIEYTDEISTINGLYSLLAEEKIASNANLSNDDIIINASFQEINLKILLKMMNICLLKEEYEANYYDLDYDEIIIFQLDIIEKICEYNKGTKYICVLDVPQLTETIYHKLSSLKVNNVKIFIIANMLDDNYINYKNVFIISSRSIDVFNEEDIYEITLEYKHDISIEDMRELIISKLNNKFTNITTDLYDS